MEILNENLNENIPLSEVPLAVTLDGATLIGVNNEGRTRRFNANSVNSPVLGEATASTVPVANAASGQYYGATAGVTYPNFGNITIPLEEDGKSVYDARLIRQGSSWVAKYSKLGVESLGNVATITGTTNALESAFVDAKTLNLGMLSNGRMTSISGEDTNSSYKKTGLVPVHPTWILSFDRTKDGNSRHIMYDEFQNQLGILTYTINQDTSLHPKIRFIRFSDLNGYMNAVTITVKESIGINLGVKINETEDKRANEQSNTDNYFNWQESIPSATLSSGNIVSNSAGLRISPFMKLKRGHSGWLAIYGVYNTINPWAFAFYAETGAFISQTAISASVVPLFPTADGRWAEVEVPANAVYFRLRWDHRAENTEEQLSKIRIIDREAWRILLANTFTFFSGEMNANRIRDIIRAERIINTSLAEKKWYKCGTSITANNMSEGSWNIWPNGALKPKMVHSRASGGATLTSGYDGFGQEYLNDGNTFMRQCELYYRDIENGTLPPPDILTIEGGTNDFGNNNPYSYVTPSELGSTPYDLYMEQTFMTPPPGHNTLIPLQEIPRTKVAGALRYIVERIGSISPNTIFIIFTPIQSTLHNQLNAQRVVRDIKWMANRLSVPVIDCWNAAGMPMLWDYGTDRRFLGDRVHPFTDSGQTRGSAVMGRFILNEFLKIFIPNV